MEEIHSAARRGDEGEVTRLLDADPTLIETDDNDGETPLVVAAEHGQLGVTRLLVQRGANINVIVQYYGRTALHYAAEEAHEEVVAFLLEKGAQTSNSEGDNVTPLMLACRNGHVGVVQMIVTHTGPQGLEDRDICGKTALRYAAEEGHGEVVALLLGKGAQASTRDDETVTPLMSACEKGHVGVVRMLITHTGPHGLEDRDTEGKTALRYAAEEGHGEVVAFLLGKGAQASTRDDENVTPLMWACDNGHLGVVRILVQHTGGEGLDTRDDQYGWTTLHGAAFWSYEEVVRFLLVSGADPTITDIEGMTALEVATQEDEYVGGDEHWRARRARCVAVFKWWEGELERRYVLSRAMCLHKAYTTQRDLPTSQVPTYLEARVAVGHAVPVVEVVVSAQSEGEQAEQAGASGKRKAASERGEPQGAEAGEEETRHAVLEYVVTGLNEALLTELLEGFYKGKGWGVRGEQ